MPRYVAIAGRRVLSSSADHSVRDLVAFSADRMSQARLDFLLDAFIDRIAERIVDRLGERWSPGSTVRFSSEILSVSEAAEVLRCKPQRVYDLRSSGRLPRTTEGGRAVVRRSDLEQLVAES
jgi:excisionase family DNA binding protein